MSFTFTNATRPPSREEFPDLMGAYFGAREKNNQNAFMQAQTSHQDAIARAAQQQQGNNELIQRLQEEKYRRENQNAQSGGMNHQDGAVPMDMLSMMQGIGDLQNNAVNPVANNNRTGGVNNDYAGYDDAELAKRIQQAMGIQKMISGGSQEGSLGKEQSKHAAQYYADAQTTDNDIMGALDNLDAIDELLNNPEFEDMVRGHTFRGAGMKWESWLGSDERQGMIGTMRTHLGQMVVDASKQFKGAFRSQEQGLLNSMKPNESDSFEQMRKKAAGFRALLESAHERFDIQSRLIDAGVPVHQAREASYKEVPSELVRHRIKEADRIRKQDENRGYTDEEVQYAADKYGITPAEVIKRLENIGKDGNRGNNSEFTQDPRTLALMKALENPRGEENELFQ